MESLQKKLAAARATTDYDTMEVVQKTIDAVQQRFALEVIQTDECTDPGGICGEYIPYEVDLLNVPTCSLRIWSW